MGLKWDPYPFASMRMAASEKAFPLHLHARDCQMPHSSDPTPTTPDSPDRYSCLCLSTLYQGAWAESNLYLEWGWGQQGKRLWSMLVAIKHLRSASPTLGCMAFWQLLPPFPPWFSVARQRGRHSWVSGVQPSLSLCSPSQCWGTGFLSA